MKKCLTLLLSLTLALSLSAQTASRQKTAPIAEAAPEAAGMSAERLQRLDQYLEKSVKDNLVPGVAAIIVRNGKIVYHKAFGSADVEGGRALKKDDIFRIASMTKAVTSACVMMLFEEGKFLLDDPISKYIPEFKNPVVLKKFTWPDSSWTTEPAKSEITIRHLLTHTSGLSYGVIAGDDQFKALYAKAGITDLYTTEPVLLADNIKKLAKLPLQFHPGERYSYGENSDVLGYFVEVLSGMSLADFMRTRLFEPLGMNDTYFYLPDSKKDRLVKVQRPNGSGSWERFPVTFYDPEYPIKGAKTWYSGGAGLSSTAKDYATFLQMLINGGEYNGKRFLSRPTVQLFTATNQTGKLFGGEEQLNVFSLGFQVTTAAGENRGMGSEGTFGWGGYFNTNYWADPKEKLIGVIMKQTQQSGDPLNEYFRILARQAIDD